MKQSRYFIVFVTLLVLLLPLGAAREASAQSRQRRPGALAIGGSNQRETYNARGRYVLISGQGNRVEIKGTATTVRVTGNNNFVRIHTARQIEVAGRNNRVVYASGKPRIYQRSGNDVRKGD